MPNNGIVSKKEVIPSEFRATSINEFNNSTDMVIINKALIGSKVEQSAVTLNQLAGMVGGGTQGMQGPMGPQGPAGPAAPSGLNWKGDYNVLLGYELNDVVLFLNPSNEVIGSYWVTSNTVDVGVKPTDENGNINEGWAFLASQGPQGIQGPAGPQGEVGPAGAPGAATLPFKELNLLLTFEDNTGDMTITTGYSSFTGGISSVNHWAQGRYQLFFSSTADDITDKSKCIITTSINGYWAAGSDFIPNAFWSVDGGSINLDVWQCSKNFTIPWQLLDLYAGAELSVNIKVYN